MLRLNGIVRVIYEHGEPHGLRDDSGFICMFNSVPKFAGQEDRYRKECEDRREIADFLCESLSKADRK